MIISLIGLLRIISVWMIFLYSMNCKLKSNKICIRLIDVLSSHGFSLTKWISNHPDVLNDIPQEMLLCQNIRLDFNSEITKRALELFWA